MTAAAVAAALEALCPGAVRHAEPAGEPDPVAALAAPELGAGAVALRAGEAVFQLSAAGAHRLAAVMMGAAPDAPVPDAALTELERTTVADALGGALGAAPRLLDAGADELAAAAALASRAVVTGFELCGEPACLVELVAAPAAPVDVPSALGLSLRATTVRLSAEIGRARLPAGRVVGTAPGSIVELDRDADEPVDLYLNGRRFALGRLELTPAGEWAVRVERVLDPGEA